MWYGRLWHLVLIVLIISSAFSSNLVQASPSNQVYISAQETGLYDLETQVFIGQGDVELRYDDTTISGDYLEWHVGQEELYITGSVVFRQGADELYGEALAYNVGTNNGSFVDVNTSYYPPNAEGAIFLSASEVQMQDFHYHIIDGAFTTCDLPHSHYHLNTREVVVTPGEKIVIRGVTYYEGKFPLFYWPYLVIPLDRDLEGSNFELPIVGYSEKEGFYLKTAYNYFFNTSSYGKIYVDLYSRLGVGYGARHYYDLGAFGNGNIYAFHIPHAEQGSVRTSLNHEWEQGPWHFVTNNAVEDSQAGQEINSTATLNLNTNTITARAFSNYRVNNVSTQVRDWRYGGSWQQSLTDNWRLRLNGSVVNREDSTRLRMVDYLAETSYVQGNHTLALAVEQKFNPDLLEEDTQPSWASVNREPELSWQIRNPQIGETALPVRLDMSIGQYQEFPSQTESIRGQASLNLLTRTWRPSKQTIFSYSGELSGAGYSTGQAQAGVFGRLNLTHQVTGNLRFNGGYSQRAVWGETPFRFDQQRDSQLLTMRLSHSGQNITTSLSGGYDFLNARYNLLIGQASWRPTDKLRLNLYASFDLNTQSPDRLAPLFEYHFDGDSMIRLGGRYHMDQGYWDRAELKFALPVGDTWNVGYDAVYNPLRGTFSRGQVNVTKDMHCRTLTLSYDHVSQNVALSLTINAFPTLPLEWGSSSGVSLFDLEDVYDIIGVEE